MKTKSILLSTGLPLLLLLGACSEQKETGKETTSPATAGTTPAVVQGVQRWYSPQQAVRGEKLFQQNCAECHKPDASGDPNWKETNADGKLPPPPLNGAGHAWHHPMPLLRQIVRNGGIPMGGSMPPFKDKLSSQQINDILAWVQTHWSDKIYTTWIQINKRAKNKQ